MFAIIAYATIAAAAAIAALAVWGLVIASEPHETIAAKRTYSHNGAVRWQRIARR